jgi:selenide, water dikinase
LKKIESCLTQTVQKGGCAAKVSAMELRSILSQVHFPKPHKELLVDGRFFDDAGVYKITESIAMVQTLDFFTPILDSPRYFGAVAAANALSDIYAMGGRPKTAMGILAFPIATMSPETIIEVMQGASDIVAESGANFVGGHSIDDDTLKFGLSVTGFVHPEKIWANTGAQVGDDLILTKALGTGTITAGLKRREIKEMDMMDVISSMSQINNAIDYLSDDQMNAIHAATDVTGFGLSGHCMQLAKASEVTLKIQTQRLPIFPMAMSCLEKNFLTKAHRSNAEYTSDSIEVESLSTLFKALIHDPQTSGGLLLSVDPKYSEQIVAALKNHFKSAEVIGQVKAFNQKSVFFE